MRWNSLAILSLAFCAWTIDASRFKIVDRSDTGSDTGSGSENSSEKKPSRRLVYEVEIPTKGTRRDNRAQSKYDKEDIRDDVKVVRHLNNAFNVVVMDTLQVNGKDLIEGFKQIRETSQLDGLFQQYKQQLIESVSRRVDTLKEIVAQMAEEPDSITITSRRDAEKLFKRQSTQNTIDSEKQARDERKILSEERKQDNKVLQKKVRNVKKDQDRKERSIQRITDSGSGKNKNKPLNYLYFEEE